MPLGTPVLSSVSIVTVGTTATPVTPVGGVLSWDWAGDSPTARRDYIGQASATAAGKESRTITLSCDYEAGDTGQLVLEDGWNSKATIYVKILPDGTNGETLPTKVANMRIAAPDANGFNTVNYTLEQFAAPVVVGLGFSG